MLDSIVTCKCVSKRQCEMNIFSIEFNIGNGGVSNLVGHSKSKKHIELRNSASCYSKLCFRKPGETVNENVSDLQNLKKPLLSAQAEIIWVLKVVYSQFTFRSCLDLSELFHL